MEKIHFDQEFDDEGRELSNATSNEESDSFDIPYCSNCYSPFSTSPNPLSSSNNPHSLSSNENSSDILKMPDVPSPFEFISVRKRLPKKSSKKRNHQKSVTSESSKSSNSPQQSLPDRDSCVCIVVFEDSSHNIVIKDVYIDRPLPRTTLSVDFYKRLFPKFKNALPESFANNNFSVDVPFISNKMNITSFRVWIAYDQDEYILLGRDLCEKLFSQKSR